MQKVYFELKNYFCLYNFSTLLDSPPDSDPIFFFKYNFRTLPDSPPDSEPYSPPDGHHNHNNHNIVTTQGTRTLNNITLLQLNNITLLKYYSKD